jgi:hypothetical protein
MVNHSLSEMQIVAMKPTRIVRRRGEVQASYGSARSDGSRLPFLLEPPATASAFCLYGFIEEHCRCAADTCCPTFYSVEAGFTAQQKQNLVWHRGFAAVCLRRLFNETVFYAPPNCFVP